MVLQRNSPVVMIDGYESVPENDENALMKAVANQPVSVAIDAGGSDLQFYAEVSFYLAPLFCSGFKISFACSQKLILKTETFVVFMYYLFLKTIT